MKVTTAARLAIIEDNEELREELMFFLEAQDYRIWGERSAESFWKHLHVSPVDIVLVDIGLPGEDGFSVLEFLRGLGSYGLIVLSARGGEQDRLRGLALGADAYLVKPVNFAQLALTIDALWQRLRQQADGAPALSATSAAQWALENTRLLAPDGLSLDLTTQEARLMAVLLQHRNEVCSKALIHERLFGFHAEADTHRVDVVLSRLRSKAQRVGMALPLRVVFGKGLVFLADNGD
ncbi:MAG: response regulator transcription factor [Burkholderiaceae bacterium]